MSRLPVIDNTDWLKTAAIISVMVGHFGYFFVENNLWWSVFGRLAAPVFFFLIGYSRSRAVPVLWIGLGIMLTALESSNARWAWVAPNILLSFALIRIAGRTLRPLAQRHGFVAFVLLVTALFAMLPITGRVVDYGAEGWLWALLGLYQRMYNDGRSATNNAGLMRLLACFAAAGAYIWQEQNEFSFSKIPFIVFIIEVCLLSILLSLFCRGPSRIQPPEPIAIVVGFIGRRTLEIYAIQLAASEIIIKLLPGLSA